MALLREGEQGVEHGREGAELAFIAEACPGWHLCYEEFVEGGGRWYGFNPARGFPADAPLFASTAVELVGRVWDIDAEWHQQQLQLAWHLPRRRSRRVSKIGMGAEER